MRHIGQHVPKVTCLGWSKIELVTILVTIDNELWRLGLVNVSLSYIWDTSYI